MKKILMLLLILLLPVGVFATETEYETKPINEVTSPVAEGPEITNTVENEIPFPTDVIDENVTIDEVGNRVIRKLQEVADVLKKIAEPISIITFIVGAILMVMGALGKRDGARQGLIVCLLSIVMYAICMYSDPIIKAVSNWLVS